jgi:hypothetical protein
MAIYGRAGGTGRQAEVRLTLSDCVLHFWGFAPFRGIFLACKVLKLRRLCLAAAHLDKAKSTFTLIVSPTEVSMGAHRKHRKKRPSMKNCGTQASARNFDYPEKSKGSEIASKIRKRANALTDKQREEYFRRGMQIIYGGNGTKEAVRSRH